MHEPDESSVDAHKDEKDSSTEDPSSADQDTESELNSKRERGESFWHEKEKWLCPQCKQSFTTQLHLVAHFETHQLSRYFVHLPICVAFYSHSFSVFTLRPQP
jgi:hypothetical protein